MVSRPALLLVGAGHAHLHAIARARDITRRGIALTLVSPAPFVYSAYIPSILGGRIAPAAGTIDPFGPIEAAGGRAHRAAVTHIDAAGRTVALDAGRSVRWDVLSLDIGSRVPADRIPGAAQRALRVKPYDEMRTLDARLRRRIEKGLATRIVVMGGGASAVELAGNLEARLRRAGAAGCVHVITESTRLLPDMNADAASAVSDHLRNRGLHIDTQRKIVQVVDDSVVDEHGHTTSYDLLVDATGLEPHDLAQRSGLPDVAGALLVDAHLRSVADPFIFGAGDAIRIRGYEDVRPIGVHAVRQGPVLLHNLIATLEGRPLRRWSPPAAHLAILDLGDGHALAVRGRRFRLGRTSRWLKDTIDARFIRRHR